MDVCFAESGYQVGQFPYEEGQSWREAGIPSTMIVRFCERQTEEHDSPTTSSIFHNGQKVYEY